MIRKTRWGKDEVIYETDTYKVKILTIDPGKGTSFQRHFHRNEEWLVLDGSASVKRTSQDSQHVDCFSFGPYDEKVTIFSGEYHQVWNHENTPLSILEIWRPDTDPIILSEADIERIQYTWEPQ